MGFLWFGKKKKGDESDKIKDEVKSSFENVKRDMSKISRWIRHLDTKDNVLEGEMGMIRDEIGGIKQDIDGIKSFVSFFDTRLASRIFKQKQTPVHKQTAVQAVQTPVQTVVQTAILRGLTANERLIIWTLLNTDLKLSYDDIAVLLGKEKSTVRGQINSIKQKSGIGLINEFLEISGKKRYYINEKVRNTIFKSIKVKTRKIEKTGRGKK
ncbi:MAG: hypothetical protein IB618_03075 [Candidatus Pacearchaeota archaeon]|nr:MAG: hypothetical protein IB618_03075 [Candidatus Pacearchaeota archaeon]